MGEWDDREKKGKRNRDYSTGGSQLHERGKKKRISTGGIVFLMDLVQTEKGKEKRKRKKGKKGISLPVVLLLMDLV